MGRNTVHPRVTIADSTQPIEPAQPAGKLLVDTSTGESWAIVEDGKDKRRYVFPGGFAFVGLVYISKLRQVKLPADGYRLALLFMESAGYAGISTKPFTEIAETLGVWPSRISTLVSALEKVGVVQKLGGQKSSNVLVNPAFCFRGSPAEQHKAIEMWAAHRPFNLVQPKEPEEHAVAS